MFTFESFAQLTQLEGSGREGGAWALHQDLSQACDQHSRSEEEKTHSMSHLVAQSKHAGIKAHNGLNNKEKLVRKTVVAPPNKAKICI